MQELEKILRELEEFTFEAEVYNNDFEGAEFDNLICLENVKDVLKKHMNDGWIPVDKDNLPDHEVLACNEDGCELIGYIDIVGYGFFCEEGDSGVCMYDVTAWMEKPEPYRPERGDNV